MGKKLLKVLGIVLLVIVVAAGGFVVFLTAAEYKPAAVEYIDAPTLGEPETPGDSVRIGTWNVGYCGLGAEEDFVMDGGSGDGRPEKETFYAYYEGVLSELGALGADIYLLQEVDADSDRSCNFNEVERFSEGRNARSSAYALNYSCPFVPFPWPPMGKVTSGILTTSDFAVEGGTAERIALPCPFSWPLRTANLKRCLLITRYALPGTDELARACAEALGQKANACLLQSHGAVCVGKDMKSAFKTARVLEMTAEIYYRIRSIGGQYIPISPENIAAMQDFVAHKYGQR